MFKPILTFVAIVAMGSIALAQSGAQTAKPTEAKPEPAKSKTQVALQGAWIMTTTNGQDMTGQAEVVITITDDKYVQTVNGEVVEKGSLKFDDSKKPVYMDVIIAEGQDAGKVQLGVIEFTNATTVRGKVANPGETTRTTDFAPTPGDGSFAFTAVKKK